MIAYLTKVSVEEKYSDPEDTVYELHFNQEPFMGHNEILLTECYFSNIRTKNLEEKTFYTAKEAGMFDKRWSEYMSVFGNQTFEEVANEHFEVIE